MNVFGIGPMELLLVLILALIFIGPAKLPEVAGQLGRAINEFRRASAELSEAFSAQLAEEVAARKAAEQASSGAAAADGAAKISTDTEWAKQFATLEPNGYTPETKPEETARVADTTGVAAQGTVLDSEAAYPPATNVAASRTDTPGDNVLASSADAASAETPTTAQVAEAASPSDTPGIEPTIALVSPNQPAGGSVDSPNVDSPNDEEAPSEAEALELEPTLTETADRSPGQPALASGVEEPDPDAATRLAEPERASADGEPDASSPETTEEVSRPRSRRGRRSRAAASAAAEDVAESPAETTESEV